MEYGTVNPGRDDKWDFFSCSVIASNLRMETSAVDNSSWKFSKLSVNILIMKYICMQLFPICNPFYPLVLSANQL